MVMQTDIDMNNHDITIKNPTNDNQPVSLAFLKSIRINYTDYGFLIHLFQIIKLYMVIY